MTTSLRGLLVIMYALFIIFAAPVAAHAQGGVNSPDEQAIAITKVLIEGVRESAKEGVISPEAASAQENFYLDQLRKDCGCQVTMDDVMSSELSPTMAEISVGERSVQSILNVLLLVAIIGFVAAIAAFFGSAIVEIAKLFKDIPLIAYEVAFYAIGLGAIVWGWSSKGAMNIYLPLIGALLLAAALAFTFNQRKVQGKGWLKYCAILTLIYIPLTIAFQNVYIGFAAATALLGTMGFAFGYMPGVAAIGFEDEKSVPRGTVAAFMLLAPFAYWQGTHTMPALLGLFQHGAIVMGSIVGMAGVSIMSSRFYPGNKTAYWLMQLVAPVALVGGLYLGSMFGVGALATTATVFLFLFALDKVLELPSDNLMGYAAQAAVSFGAIIAAILWVFNNWHVVRSLLVLPGM